MTALAATQREFIDALYSQDPVDAGVAIYRRNMFANLGNALAATFPVVSRLVGDVFFREAARQFVLGHPSRSGDLNEYGEAFGDFLAAYPHARSLPYLADVARLEWSCHMSEQSADAAPFDLAALASVAPEDYPRIRFALHPAVRLVRSAHPIEAIWSANQADQDGTPARHDGPDAVLVTRHDGSARVQRIAEDEWRFLAALAEGATLEQASERVGDEAVAAFLAGGLARWVQEGIVAGFSLGSRAA